jgi:hypothetical protein
MFAPILLLLCPTSVLSVKLLDFDAARRSPGEAVSSSVVLRSSQADKLPNRFILCSSSKQGKIDRKSPYVLRGDDNMPWLTFSTSLEDDGPYLWADVQKGIFSFKLHLVDVPWTNVWMHICADVDTTTGTLIVSLNGKPSLNVTTPFLSEKYPKYVSGKLEIGRSELMEADGGLRQFFGSVTNVNIFHYDISKSVETMSKDPCLQVGDLMDWGKVTLEWKGIPLTVSDVDTDKICQDLQEKYSLLLPVTLSSREAAQGCNILGKGNMSEIKDTKEMLSKVLWVRERRNSCKELCSPVNDETTEGVFINSNDGTNETFLPWNGGQPNGGRSQNAVTLMLDNVGYNDRPEREECCVSCDINVTTTFRLRGLCSRSYLGKRIFSNYSYLSIADARYVAVHGDVLYSGILATDIR